MNYKLYYADGTASMGVRVLLEEIGAPYLVSVNQEALEEIPPMIVKATHAGSGS